MPTLRPSEPGVLRVARVLDPEPIASLPEYLDQGGGRGIEAARAVAAGVIFDELEASGLRGRGGAGFPTGRKWRAVAGSTLPMTVVINAAEGEPGSFKDRALLRRNPYRVLEGALIAAYALGAARVVVATKASFGREIERLRNAIDELAVAGWTDDLELSVHEGPGEYLYGEETALLEVLEGRAPFPRVAPPYRQGLDEIGEAPTLVNNVETFANVAGIIAEGAAWFRSLGTEQSPGTIVCTVTGRTARHGIGEFPMGTPLRQIIEEIGGGPETDRRIVAVLSGVANPLVPERLLDTPTTYEDMQAIGSGLGAAGFLVFDDSVDMVAVAHGVSRSLAVESCGQCTPCKQDGLMIADALDRLRQNTADAGDVDIVKAKLATITDGARCFLANQHERVVASVLALFPEQFQAHTDAAIDPAPVEVIVPIADLEGDQATLDDGELAKQPDWTYDDTDSGQSPADRIDQREEEG